MNTDFYWYNKLEWGLPLHNKPKQNKRLACVPSLRPKSQAKGLCPRPKERRKPSPCDIGGHHDFSKPTKSREMNAQQRAPTPTRGKGNYEFCGKSARLRSPLEPSLATFHFSSAVSRCPLERREGNNLGKEQELLTPDHSSHTHIHTCLLVFRGSLMHVAVVLARRPSGGVASHQQPLLQSASSFSLVAPRGAACIRTSTQTVRGRRHPRLDVYHE